MRRQETKEIGGVQYTCTQFIPTHALKYQITLLKVIGGPLGALAGEISLDDAGKLLDRKVDVAAGMKVLSEGLDGEKHVGLIKDLLSQTLADGKAINFDVHFQERLGDIFAVLAFVVEVNYSDFFRQIGGLIGSAIGKLSEKNPPIQ